MILKLKKPETPFCVIGAINRALGDDHSFRRDYTKLDKIPNNAEKDVIDVHEKKAYEQRDSPKGRIIYFLAYSVSEIDVGKNPMYVKKNTFEVYSIEDSLLEKILEQLK